MKIIAITGMIGAGKSRVGNFLAARNRWPLLSCDVIAAELMAQGQDGWLALHQCAPRFILADGAVDRVALREAIFADDSLRFRLNELVHPLILGVINQQIKLLGHKERYMIIEVPLLFEANWQDNFPHIICVFSRPEVILSRLLARDKCPTKQAKAAMAAQSSIINKIEYADHIIDNSGSWALTTLQLIHLSRVLLAI